jgi:hypothetical protein
LSGDRINFVIVDDSGSLDTNLYFDGKVAGDAIEGTIVRGIGSDQKQIAWRAARIPPAK